MLKMFLSRFSNISINKLLTTIHCRFLLFEKENSYFVRNISILATSNQFHCFTSGIIELHSPFSFLDFPVLHITLHPVLEISILDKIVILLVLKYRLFLENEKGNWGEEKRKPEGL